MNAIVTPAPLVGSVAALPSKSQAHRLLICAALSNGTTRIDTPCAGQDIAATVRCLRALGARLDGDGSGYTVTPIQTPPTTCLLDVGESGTTLRLLLPVVCALGVRATFVLHGRLAQRPMEPLWSELSRHGTKLSRGEATIEASGRLTGTAFTLAANVSSQFLSGILLALPLLGGGVLHMDGTLESQGYVQMTVDALRRFGATAAWKNQTIYIEGALQSPGHCAVEGDWSNAAFWLCANAMGENQIALTGLDSASHQGDSAILGAISAVQAGGARLDCRQIPDLVPPLAVLAALTPGQTQFCHAARLRLKESDRLQACTLMIHALGGHAAQSSDGFTVVGQPWLSGGTVDSFRDHRIAMAAAIAATRCRKPVRILNAQAVEKSYAAFWEDYCRLGGSVAWEDAT